MGITCSGGAPSVIWRRRRCSPGRLRRRCRCWRSSRTGPGSTSNPGRSILPTAAAASSARTTPKPSGASRPRWRPAAARGACGPSSSRAPNSATGSGCAAPGGAATPARTCGLPLRPSNGSAPPPGPSAPARSCAVRTWTAGHCEGRMRILLVEDERPLAETLRRGLEAEHFAVELAFDGNDGLWLAQEHPFDAIVLDIMLPGMNGYKVCAALREAGNWTPVLMLTAKDGELDEAEALDTGADDYVTKPFSFVVLVARLRALLRRGPRERPAVLSAGDLRLDPAGHHCQRDGTEITLTAREFALLELLLRHRGEVLSK